MTEEQLLKAMTTGIQNLQNIETMLQENKDCRPTQRVCYQSQYCQLQELYSQFSEYANSVQQRAKTVGLDITNLG